MSETPFYKTRMGHQFLEGTIPALVKQIEELNRNLAKRVLDDPGVDEPLLATFGLVNAATIVLDVEIVPGSDRTREAFRNLRERMQPARAAADALVQRSKSRHSA